MTWPPGREKLSAKVGICAAEVVDAEDQVVGQRGAVAPQRPADAGVDEAELVAGRVDRGDAGEAEVPDELRVAERRDHGAGGPVDVDGDVEPVRCCRSSSAAQMSATGS